MKVLLIEDSRFQRMANGRALAKAGYDVIYAADGEDGLGAARESIPDLVLLDIMLPKKYNARQSSRLGPGIS